jgi:hypothetical protein
MRRTLYSHCLTQPALASAARTNGTVNGITVDLGVYGNDFRSALFIVTTGTVTDGSHAITIQDSPDGTNWTAVPAVKRQGSLPTIVAANDDALFEFGYIVGTNQYVRVVATTSGATTGGVFSAVAVLSGASSSPVARA